MNIKSYQHNIAFVIPTSSNTDGLRDLLADLSKVYANSQVVIVNNGKNALHNLVDTSAYKLQIMVLDQGKNTGFAKACNDGAKIARETWGPQRIIFLNDDIRFTTDWLSQCISTMDKKKWFATTPILKKPDGIVENIGYKVLPQGRILEIRDTRYTLRESIDGLTAAALVVNAKDFFLMRGFDERFFAYLEDVDLFLRAKKNGKKFGITTSSFVIHEGQGTSSKMKVLKAWLDLRNWYLLIYKHWKREDYLKHGVDIAIERLRNLSGLMKSII
jgi:N-acetylglucosaminyl-diphospho-decaprenol L-rhamnosyltransferase